ncbi:hypothetical protein [Leptolyngbya sp. O-77]|uniref:hypothetical protein n=1 Tax=Leptolyngbya sp. O-77 TaxID=1080068 RepID=UPI00074D4218|nr:hypothetical protein [Leptolyngbya sp. O-77]BAU42701.1 hypothetical protein O77CONTIG1_02523 [Leptolyngbya sp. O-77]
MTQRPYRRSRMVKLAIASFGALLFAAACDRAPEAGIGEVTESPVASPAAPADAPAAGDAPAAATSPAPATATAIAPGSVRCNTPNHLAEVAQQNGQSVLQIVKKPSEVIATSQPGGLATLANPDGSTTYGIVSGSTFYVRVFPNGTCFIQVLDTNGAVSLEENGVS